MADDLQDRGACDRSRVKLQEDYEIRHRPQKRGITKDQLVETSDRQAFRRKPLRANWGGPCHE
jgi:hypothetical protein